MTKDGWANVRRRVAELGRAEVRVGIVGPKAHEVHEDSNLTILELSIIHELGLPRHGIPERSFIRAALQEGATQMELKSLYHRCAKEVLAGRMSRDQALREIGAWAAAKIRTFVQEGKVQPPLAPSTVAAKGHALPLVDTHELIDAIGWDLNK